MATATNIEERPARGRYPTFVGASFGHTIQAMFRQQRLLLAAVVAFLPVLLPLAIAFLSRTRFAEDGMEVFVQMVEQLHINALAPLLALFFATMLVGEDVERQTISYVLTRPAPRSAWVLGRFLAYAMVASAILVASVLLTFAACTTLGDLSFDAAGLELMAHYDGVIVLSLLAYGALTMFLGAIGRRPIVLGVALIYGWQPLVAFVPGLIDFFTVRKYVKAILPKLATERTSEKIQAAWGELQKTELLIGAGKAVVVLLCITAVFVVLTVLTVRIRQYATDHAIGT